MDLIAATKNTENEPHGAKNQQALKWVRRAWLVLAVFLFVTFVISIPGTYQMIQTLCVAGTSDCRSWAQPTPEIMVRIEQSGISLQTSSLYLTTLYVAVSLVFWVVGLLIYYYRRDQWFALLVAHLMVIMGAGGVSLVFSSGLDFTSVPLFVSIVAGLLTLSMYQFISLFLLTFPNGKFYGRWNLIPFILICLNTLAWLAPPPLNIEFWGEAVGSAWLMIVFGSHLVAQVIRYRKMYNSSERQQTKWLIYGFSIPIGLLLSLSLLSATGAIGSNGVHPLIDHTLVVILYLPIGLATGIAILRYKLWDIDIIINHTLVYAVLTTVLVAVYALTVGMLSRLIQDDSNFFVSLLGAGIIAVLFQPLRTALQKAINRWMFGRRDEPLKVMVDLGKSLEVMASPEAALSYLVATTAQTLKLPYVAIGNGDNAVLASFGNERTECECFPLVYQAENIGSLFVSARSPGESLSAADRLVLENVARQMSSVLHAARLTEDLQQSRLQILTTREEERRRLRRDLHDGLGPALATLTLQAEAAREWLSMDPDRSDKLLQEIISGSQNTLADIRRIVYDLRPPALDDLGLIPAIREQATRYTKNDLSIVVEAPEQLPSLPAAVEVATYRIVQEALTNVARHAQAHHCTVCLRLNGGMDIEIKDDGIGIPITRRAGVGLNSIHERAAELGGSCEIASEPGQGTQIMVSLPRE